MRAPKVVDFYTAAWPDFTPALTQLAEVAVTGPMVRAIIAVIRRLREPPLCA